MSRLGARSIASWLLAAGCGVLYAFAQPNWGAWPLAFLCLAPLLVAFRGADAKRRAALGWFAGTVATVLATAVAGTVGSAAYFGVSRLAAAGIALSIGQLFGSLSFALFAVLCGDPSRERPLIAALRAGSAWCACEFIRCNAFGGLPWILLSYSLAPAPELAQSASVGGALFVSFWLAAQNAVLARTCVSGLRGSFASWALVLAMAGSGHLADLLADGDVRDPRAGAPSPRPGAETGGSRQPLRVLLAQSNVTSELRDTPGGVRRSLREFVELTRAKGPIDLAVWPESAVSAVLPFNEALVKSVLAELPGEIEFLILGALRAVPGDPSQILNSALLLGPERHVLGAHDKVHLLPFAEYQPWPLSILYDGGFRGVAGSAPVVLQAGRTAVGPLICYELLFSQLARAQVRGGAELLVNLSNDGYWGATGAVEQHLAAAVLRAIELRRPLLRATTTGITAHIDHRGHLRRRLPMHRSAHVVAEVTPRAGLTPFARWGEVVPWMASLFALTAALRDASRPTCSGPP